jgi:phosphatidylserine decarboxylase
VITYIDRSTGQEKEEKVYGRFFINLLYGQGLFSQIAAPFLLPLLSRCSLPSKVYGALQKSRLSKCKIAPFISKFQIDTSEFLEPVSHFNSFNDFFIRKLKPSARPIALGDKTAILPADGRYLVYDHIGLSDGFFVKGKKFCLTTLLCDAKLADKYANGSMVIARLAPVDYHRFHFPVACIPSHPKPIEGHLFSVNPSALKKHSQILAENRRVITSLQTDHFGTLLFVEVGATNVGTIHQTFTPNTPCSKGEEKGYFSFGGSSLILLFEPNKIRFDADLINASAKRIEVLGRMGQTLGGAV